MATPKPTTTDAGCIVLIVPHGASKSRRIIVPLEECGSGWRVALPGGIELRRARPALRDLRALHEELVDGLRRRATPSRKSNAFHRREPGDIASAAHDTHGRSFLPWTPKTRRWRSPVPKSEEFRLEEILFEV